jgi:hypothetical protein
MDKQTTIEYLKKASANWQRRGSSRRDPRRVRDDGGGNMPFEILDGISYDWLTMVEQVEARSTT